ncbi:MAG: hypothetical protein A2016_00295 [Elusimicrobia bacterium GWF2_62_30]|nr:MAG: hypothetical protein A2016_00295 [Elusimicrobia bacterium GWF2_62_30]
MKAFIEKIKNLEHRAVPLLLRGLAVLLLACIPYKVLGTGYLPPDDATRHAAKAVSEKSWGEILVLRGGAELDPEQGWNSLLGAVRKLTGRDQKGLVRFSVAALFVLFACVPLLLVKRPEAWLLALLLLVVANFDIFGRLLTGRPFLFTTLYVAAAALTWRRLREKPAAYGLLGALTLLAALAAWTNTALFLPAALFCLALFLAREWRAGAALSATALAGTLLGAVLTGRPLSFLAQAPERLFLTLKLYLPQAARVGEFQPATGDYRLLLIVVFFLMWRALKKDRGAAAAADPVFLLLALGWVGGFVSARLWLDLGITAWLVWTCGQLEEILEAAGSLLSLKRLVFAAALLPALYLAAVNDSYGRWSSIGPYTWMAEVAEQDAGWLPGKGGVVYSSDSGIFYCMFFHQPRAEWKYVLGAEPALMPAGDLAVFNEILALKGAAAAYAPWTAKMKPEDRLVLAGSAVRPAIPGLEWNYLADQVWFGRLPAPKKKPGDGRRAS